jgi:hypothetical protein
MNYQIRVSDNELMQNGDTTLFEGKAFTGIRIKRYENRQKKH